MPRTALRGRITGVAFLLLAGALGIYAAARAGGTGAGLLAAAAVGCAVALLLHRDRTFGQLSALGHPFDVALLLAPAALTVYLAFQSGGYFPTGPAVVAILLVIALVLRLTLADHPFAGFSWPLAVAVGGLGLFALWILLSATWSDAPARALLDFDRALVYLLALVLFGSIPRTPERLRLMAGGLALGIVAIATVALATRLFPTTFPTVPNLGDSHLSYPLTYSNALALLCAIGVLLCLYFTTSISEPVVARALAAAALPILVTTAYLTQSRGPIAAGAVGVAAFVVLGRPRGLVPGLIAVLPVSLVAVVAAHQQELLTAFEPSRDALADQGRPVAVIVAFCVVAAAALRLLLVLLDRRLETFALAPRLRRPVIVSGWAAVTVVSLVVAVAADAPGVISDQYDRFVETGDRGLVENWSVALKAFRDEPFHGYGAGAYEIVWNERRPTAQYGYAVTDAHSLYLEVLGELGVVGAVLLLAVLGALLAAAAPFRRGPDRALFAALFAAALVWLAHAGVEWDWEMPAVTVWFFALGAACLAARPRPEPRDGPRQSVRVVLGLLLLGVAVTPALVLASQRQLDDAVAAYDRGDCPRAVDRATASIETLEIRPEPYEVIAACQARRGSDLLAIRAMLMAVDRDPDHWRYRYELGIARGAAGIDPLPDLRAARRLNPGKHEIGATIATIQTGTTFAWEPALAPSRFGRR